MKQITLITENRPGLLADITVALAEANVNIEFLEAENIDHAGVMVLEVDQYDLALQVINTLPEVKAISEDVILVKIKDERGALARIAKRFKEAEINIRSIRIIKRNAEQSFVAICTERTQEASKLVEDIVIS